jgi:hypothetical protein
MKRTGNWIQTFKGIAFYPLDPREEDIDIEDIAHSLSRQCRFGGHCIEFYSVAEHCCHIYDFCSNENKLWGLLHDATEAYIVDVPKPIKNHLTNYKEIENNLMNVIAKKFNLVGEMPKEIKELDTAILFTEAEQDMNIPPMEWENRVEALDLKLQFWNPNRAKLEFLNRFNKTIYK